MVQRIVWLLLFLVFYCGHGQARVPLKNRALFFTEEKINDRTFSHRLELLEGHHKDIWKVDGEPVDQVTYEELVLEAEKEERRQERRREYEERVANHIFKQRAQEALLKKLLKSSVDAVRREVRLLEKYHLAGYYTFTPVTIADQEEYDHVVYELIPRIEQLLNSSEPVDHHDLVALYAQVETYEDRLKSFARATIAHAIEQCDDTKLLKDLLALVS